MKTFYETYISHNFWFKLLSLSAVILLIASFIVPPMGVIDSSVIAAVGEIFAFAALYTLGNAIEKGKSATITKGDVELTIGDKEDKNTDN